MNKYKTAGEKVGKWAGGKIRPALFLLTFTLSHFHTFSASAATVTGLVHLATQQLSVSNRYVFTPATPVLNDRGGYTRTVPVTVTVGTNGTFSVVLEANSYLMSDALYPKDTVRVCVPNDAFTYDFRTLICNSTVYGTTNLPSTYLRGVAPGLHVTTSTNDGVVTVNSTASGGGGGGNISSINSLTDPDITVALSTNGAAPAISNNSPSTIYVLQPWSAAARSGPLHSNDFQFFTGKLTSNVWWAAWGSLGTNALTAKLDSNVWWNAWGSLSTNGLTAKLDSNAWWTAWGSLSSNAITAKLDSNIWWNSWGSLSSNSITAKLDSNAWWTAWGSLSSNAITGKLDSNVWWTAWGSLGTNALSGKQNGATNENQFGASTTLSIKDGARFTNVLNVGTFTNSDAINNAAGFTNFGPADFRSAIKTPLATNALVSVAADGTLRTNKLGGGVNVEADGTLHASNAVVVAEGTGITVTSSGSGGRQTFTVNATGGGAGVTNAIGTGKAEGSTIGINLTTIGVSNTASISWGALSNAGGTITYTANVTTGVTNAMNTRLANLEGTSNSFYNGEVSLTNGTRIGLVYDRSKETNRLRSVQGGSGVLLTNEGTNIMFAVDPAVVALQSDLTAKVSDTAFASSWNGVTTIAPSKNAVYDWAHIFDTDDDGKVNVLDLAAGIPKTDSSGVLSLATLGTDYLDSTYISDTAFAGSWDGVTTIAPTKNAVYDKIAVLQTGDNAISNLVGTVAKNVTNENSTALQIDSGTLSLTPGVASNLVASTIDVPGSANVISNLAGLKYGICLPAITVSNLVVSFNTNVIECVGLTNVQLTNIVEELNGVNGQCRVVIRNTLSVSVPVLLPAFGAQHGYYFHTNGLNDVLSATVAPPGTNTVFSFAADGTNIYPRVTYWRHP